MDFIEKHITSFIINTLKILFILLLIGSILTAAFLFKNYFYNNAGYFVLINSILAIFSLTIGYLFYRYLKCSTNYKNALLIILSLGFFIRIICIFAITTQPFSDFGLMFTCGDNFAKGEYWMFKGTNYIGRFTHLTAFTIYLGLIQKYFINALLIIKIINVILSTINIYLIYLISNALFSKKNALWISLISCLFPPFIFYNSVTCSENIAMPFFLLSVYLFILAIKSKKAPMWLLFSGVVLSIGNIFRFVGIILLIAYMVYLLIYWNQSKKKLVLSCSLLLISFIIPLYLTSSILIGLGITEYPLWRGSEPNITSVLKGTNIEANGMWNEEDSQIPILYNYDYKAVEKASKEIIIERLTKTPFHKLAVFYIKKFTMQWSMGDFSAIYWSTTKVFTENQVSRFSRLAHFFSQLYYIAMVAFCLLGLFNREYRTKNNMINLFYIIFCGYGLFYLLTEMQTRYAYIVSWIFPILSYLGVLLFLEKRKSIEP